MPEIIKKEIKEIKREIAKEKAMKKEKILTLRRKVEKAILEKKLKKLKRRPLLGLGFKRNLSRLRYSKTKVIKRRKPVKKRRKRKVKRR